MFLKSNLKEAKKRNNIGSNKTKQTILRKEMKAQKDPSVVM